VFFEHPPGRMPARKQIAARIEKTFILSTLLKCYLVKSKKPFLKKNKQISIQKDLRKAED
jgi:hypothetical protein